MSLIGKKYVNLLAHMHMYYQLVSLLLLTYVVYLSRYVLREESGLSLGLVEIFIKKLYFFFDTEC